ncbi:MAG: LysR substrate-binding domain-containing protein [Pseudomonadota bacterium]|nr:LysR substrate-binding domain-containing protein [Pseudomonadota bacterium]
MPMNLRTVDLNLLTAFEALMAEGSVTRGAKRLGVSQPALSEALARLRFLFNDPLFVRGRGGMIPTRKARAVAEPVAAALASIRLALEGTPFEARNTERTFRIGLGDYGEAIILPPLLRRLTAEAPQANLRSVAITAESAIDLVDRGEIDLAIEVFPPALPDRFWRVTLLHEHALCLTDVAGPISEKAYLELPHVVRSPVGSVGTSIVDVALRERGQSRRVTANVANVLTLSLLLKGSSFIATQPGRIAKLLASGTSLRIEPPPIDLPSWRVELVGGTGSAHDPALGWLRRLIVETCDGL